MSKKCQIATPKEFFRRKYELLDSKEIAALNKTKTNSSFEEWYEALQAYTDSQGGDWERSLVTDCGEECWKEAYEDDMEVSEAFESGFRE